MVTIADVLKIIIEWASCHDELEEIYLTGSQSNRNFDDDVGVDSDIDLILIVEGEEVADWIYSGLAKIGLKIGKLIHPLVLNKNDVEMKKTIANYDRAISSGKRIYLKYREMPNL